MLDYLQKFSELPKQLRDKMSARAVLNAVEELEEKYNINLAATVMKIIVKDIAVDNLAEGLIAEFKLNKEEVLCFERR